MAKAHLVWSIESVLDYQSVFFVLGGITAVSGSQPQDLIHSPGLSLQPNTSHLSSEVLEGENMLHLVEFECVSGSC